MTYNPSRRTERRLDAARGYLELSMPDQALEELDEIADPEHFAFDWHLLRGEAFRDRKDYRAAIKAYHHAQSARPDELAVFMGLAWCYKRTGQLSKSIEMMHQAYLAHRDQAIVLYNLSCYYSLAGNKDQALSWLGRALRMSSDLRELIDQESDFDSLRGDADFQHLIQLAGHKSSTS